MSAASFIDRPCAAPGLVSYRARTAHGVIMIGARDDADAHNEVARSIGVIGRPMPPYTLERWNGNAYEEVR